VRGKTNSRRMLAAKTSRVTEDGRQLPDKDLRDKRKRGSCGTEKRHFQISRSADNADDPPRGRDRAIYPRFRDLIESPMDSARCTTVPGSVSYR